MRSTGLPDRMVALRRDIHAHPELAWKEIRTTALVTHELVQAGLAPTALPGGPVWCATSSATGAVPRWLCEPTSTPCRSTMRKTSRIVRPSRGSPTPAATTSIPRWCSGPESAWPGWRWPASCPAGSGWCSSRPRRCFPGGRWQRWSRAPWRGCDGCSPCIAILASTPGRCAVRTGPITAATDSVTVRLAGPGGHTARPQLTVDLVAALADVLARTPALLSRRVDPRAGLSLVWGTVTAGSAGNVIPQQGEASGTVRVLERGVWESAAELIPELIHQIAAPYRARVEVDYQRGVPPAVNDPLATETFRVAAAALLGPGAVHEAPQSMGAEDFAWFLDRVPGVLGRLGVRRPGNADAPDLHRGDFDVDEAAIGCGTRVLLVAAHEQRSAIPRCRDLTRRVRSPSARRLSTARVLVAPGPS